MRKATIGQNNRITREANVLGLDYEMRRLLALIGGLGERGGVMIGGRFLGVGRIASREEPAYVRTTPFDGGKYIDAKTFLEDEDIQKQFELFEQSDGHPQPEQSDDEQRGS
jgi:hypothetical protein